MIFKNSYFRTKTSCLSPLSRSLSPLGDLIKWSSQLEIEEEDNENDNDVTDSNDDAYDAHDVDVLLKSLNARVFCKTSLKSSQKGSGRDSK